MCTCVGETSSPTFQATGGNLGAPSVIVLVVDRLGAGFLGPYGNTWVETPEFNRLASDSLLLEQTITDGVRLEDVYRSFWLGTHSMRETSAGLAPPLAAAATAAGIPTTLLTDDSRFTDLPQAADFRERIHLAARNRQRSRLNHCGLSARSVFCRGHRVAGACQAPLRAVAARAGHGRSLGRALGIPLAVCRRGRSSPSAFRTTTRPTAGRRDSIRTKSWVSRRPTPARCCSWTRAWARSWRRWPNCRTRATRCSCSRRRGDSRWASMAGLAAAAIGCLPRCSRSLCCCGCLAGSTRANDCKRSCNRPTCMRPSHTGSV